MRNNSSNNSKQLAFNGVVKSLKDENLTQFFYHLNHLYHFYLSDPSFKKKTLREFSQSLFEDQKERDTLDDQEINFYQAICRSLQGFNIIAAAITGTLLKERNHQDNTYLSRYPHIAQTTSNDPLDANHPDFIFAQQNILRIRAGANAAEAFAPFTRDTETEYEKRSLNSIATQKAALDAFYDLKPDLSQERTLEEWADHYWNECINALNNKNNRLFYTNLSNLYQAMVENFRVNGKRNSGDNQSQFFIALHSRVGATEENFREKFLNEVGKLDFDILFNHNVDVFKSIIEETPDEKEQDEYLINRKKRMTANQMFFLLFPLPERYHSENANDRQNQVNSAFNWIDEQYRERANQKIAAQYAFLLYLKKESENPQWDTEGTGYFFHKVPTTIKHLRQLLAELPEAQPNNKEVRHLFQNHIITSDCYKKSKKQWNRSPRTKAFYEKVKRLHLTTTNTGAMPWLEEEKIANAKYLFLVNLKMFTEDENEQWETKGQSINPLQLIPFISCCVPNMGRKIPAGIAQLRKSLGAEFKMSEYDPKYQPLINRAFDQASDTLFKKQHTRLSRSREMQTHYDQWLAFRNDAELGLTKNMNQFMQNRNPIASAA